MVLLGLSVVCGRAEVGDCVVDILRLTNFLLTGLLLEGCGEVTFGDRYWYSSAKKCSYYIQ